MATITKSIGTSSRDYSTITLWEAALSGAAGGAGNDAIGECYNDSAFDEVVIINDATPDSVLLTVPSSERHDGTAGTGARIVRSGSDALNIQTPSGFNGKYTVDWLEIDLNNNGGPAIGCNNQAFGNVGILCNLIVHDQSGGFSFDGFINAASRDVQVRNSFFYNNSRATSLTVYGLRIDGDQVSGGVYNNTVYNVGNPSTGDSLGIFVTTNSANHENKNNISVATTSGSGTTKDFSFPGTSIDGDYNLSSDDTADDAGGTNCLLNKSASNQFVSIVGGSEDLHLKSGSDAIDAGVDLGTTPTGVNIDINGRDRDAEGDTWDIGAHEFVSAGVTIIAGAGVYTYTGTSAILKHAHTLDIASGSYSLTGQDVTLTVGTQKIITPDPGSYTISGTDASLLYGRKLASSPDSYILTGSDVTLTYAQGIVFSLDPGSYSVTGTATSLLKDSIITPEAGSYTITGSPTTLQKGYHLSIDNGVYSLTGTAVDFIRDYLASLDPGSYNIIGTSVTLSYSGEVLPIGKVTITIEASNALINISAKAPIISIS